MNKQKELNLIKSVFVSLLMLLTGAVVHAQDVTLAGPGGCGGSATTGTWTVPCDVTSITVEVYGAGGGGGGGGGGSNNGVYDTEGGGGAGAGGYSSLTMNVTPGSQFTYSVGQGGCGGDNGSDFNDGDNGVSGIGSSFSGNNASGNSVSLVAGGGVRGGGGDGQEGGTGSGGPGGSASGGSTNIPGGSGNNGNGGDGGLGGDAGGPNGGTGGIPDSGNGSNYGGGGAGGGNSDGGNGGAGAILITYVTQGAFMPTIVTTSAGCAEGGSATVSNYDPSMTYTFTPPGPIVGAGGVISGTVSGTNYTMVASVGICNSDPTPSFSVEDQYTAPIVSISGDLEYCEGGNTLITAQGASTYEWDDPSNSTTASITATVGSYTVIGTDANGCTDFASVTVSELTNPSISITGDLDYCEGGSTTLTGNGGVSYVWDDPTNTTTADIAVSSGTFTVTGTDANGCTGTATAVVSEIPSPTVDLGADQAVCGQGTVVLDAGAGFASYNWSTSDVTQTSEVGTGTHWVEVNDGNCSATDTIVVSANPNPEPVIPGGDQSICDGGSVTLDAGAGYTSYLWAPNAEATQTIDVTVTGTYSAMVTDANGCIGYTDTVEITLANITAPILSPSGPINLCDGDSVTIDAGSGYDTYAWSNGGSTQTITVYDSGNYSTAVTIGSCVAKSDTVEVIVHEVLPVIIENGNELSVAGNYSSYQWYFNGTLISGATTNTHVAQTSGAYTIEVTGDFGCTGSYTLEFTVNDIDELDLSQFVQIVPNPNNGSFALLSNHSDMPVSLELVNSLGQLIESRQVTGVQDLSFGIETGGTYLIRVVYEEGIATKRVVVR